jgi:hypothetical protein
MSFTRRTQSAGNTPRLASRPVSLLTVAREQRYVDRKCGLLAVFSALVLQWSHRKIPGHYVSSGRTFSYTVKFHVPGESLDASRYIVLDFRAQEWTTYILQP